MRTIKKSILSIFLLISFTCVFSQEKFELYNYKAKVIDVYDGDTVTLNISLGFSTYCIERVRLYGINAPEMRGPEKVEGKKSRDYLRNLILNKNIILKSIKDKRGKYGRILGRLFIKDPNGKYISVNDLMVTRGLAEYKNY